MLNHAQFGTNKYQYHEPQPPKQTQAMHTSDIGLQAIRDREGLRLNVYLDTTGTRTIGYGHTGGIALHEVIDKAEAEQLLMQDCKLVENTLHEHGPVITTQSVFDALVSFGYNVGTERLKHSDVLRHIKEGDITRAADALLGWSKSKGKHIPALYRRRQSEAAQMLNLPF